MFVVRKYILAQSAQEALKKERRYKPDEVFLDKDQPADRLESCIGFHVEHDYYSSDEWAEKFKNNKK